ncbi:hypothetical protein IMZ48_46420 [Candidatus Bathyarchaeota archaeon]|nr:hypothetical protein [Candidatus Bathyarchaeota archaeon]
MIPAAFTLNRSVAAKVSARRGADLDNTEDILRFGLTITEFRTLCLAANQPSVLRLTAKQRHELPMAV